MKANFKEFDDGCCSVVVHKNSTSFAFAYRRDSTYTANIYIEKIKIHGKEAIKQYKTTKGYSFHTIILKDGWFMGAGGASFRPSGGSDSKNPYDYLEKLGGKIVSKGKITKNDMETARKFMKKFTMAHFVIKSPKGNFGVLISLKSSKMIKTFKMKNGEYLCVPNSPRHYKKGVYVVKKSSLANVAIRVAGTDRWGGSTRRQVIAYDVINIKNSTKINIWATNDTGKLCGRVSKVQPDNIYYNKTKTSSKSIPKIPKKVYIGKAILN